MEKYNFGILNHIDRIKEIAVRNELPFFNVLGAYVGSNTKIYNKNLGAVGKLKYSLQLEEDALRLTERYLDIKRRKELNKLR